MLLFTIKGKKKQNQTKQKQNKTQYQHWEPLHTDTLLFMTTGETFQIYVRFIYPGRLDMRTKASG